MNKELMRRMIEFIKWNANSYYKSIGIPTCNYCGNSLEYGHDTNCQWKGLHDDIEEELKKAEER